MTTNYFIYTYPHKHITYTNTNPNISTIILPYSNINYYIQHGLFEQNIIDYAKQFCSTDKNFIDIGSHTGTYSILLSPYTKLTYAFEPQKLTYYALCGSVALSNINNINCYQCGLGSQEQIGCQTLNIISNDGGGSTMHTPNNLSIIKTENIIIKTLDSFNLENISLIKIDVENNELHVIKGAINTLKKSNYPPIIFEANDNIHLNEISNYICKFDYKIENILNSNNMFLAKHY